MRQNLFEQVGLFRDATKMIRRGGAGGHRTLLIFGHKSPHVIHYSNRSIYLSATPERRGDGGRFSGHWI